MTDAMVRTAIVEELKACGYVVPESGQQLDLVGLGVNSAALIQILSALEDTFDVDLDVEQLFSEPVTVARLEAQIATLL
ncbi:acyl carrier protein [Streptomyces alkaliphilus]|uniref:acyl carrier protein n=1 Tax=Streptomyces alkaliphilus TaxID=1472722 RepID=UPI001180ECF9|nr:acyl carrier protein [Streptomyces alkaliphilus]MQS05633.1 hypothetical protein [Streptomyces alkaliphilus]